MSRLSIIYKSTYRFCAKYVWFASVLVFTACSKTIQVTIPPASQQVVVDGSIDIGVPPIVLLTTSQQFFGNTNLNNLSAYFVHGAKIKVSGSDGTQVQLVEFCLGSLNLPPSQTQQLLSALGYTSVDSANAINVCAYTVPDIVNYYTTGTCSYMGKQSTTYNLDVMSPPIYSGQKDSIHLTSSTKILKPLGVDSLVVRLDQNAQYADSFSAVFLYVSVPDSFGNFIRYETRETGQPFYPPFGGSVYDDVLFAGKTIGLPLERGQPPNATYNANTDTYFYRGDTLTLKWSNIDANTYNFFFTLENDGGNSPFSNPVKIQSNVTNGLGVWAGYATSYYSVYVPK